MPSAAIKTAPLSPAADAEPLDAATFRSFSDLARHFGIQEAPSPSASPKDCPAPRPAFEDAGLSSEDCEEEHFPEVSPEEQLAAETSHPFSEPDERSALKAVLSGWGSYPLSELYSPDGVALVCNLVNLHCKVTADVYWLKERMTTWLAVNHPRAVYVPQEGCLYVETPVGQVSFHLYYSPYERPCTGGRAELRERSQENAPALLAQFLTERRERE
jgi:hypothetical protein